MEIREVPKRPVQIAPTTSPKKHPPPSVVGYHRLTVEQFARLARGGGGRAEAEVLVASQRSKRRTQLLAVVRGARRAGSAAGAATDRAIRLLGAADARRPDEVRVVLAHPYLDNWANACLRQLAGGGGIGGPDRDAVDSLGYLGALAAAAAARSGLSFELTLPSRSGAIVLPTLGAATGLGDGPVRVVGEPGRLTFAGTTRTVVVPAPLDERSGHWAPTRLLRAEDPDDDYTLMIEDLDPYRDCHHWPPAKRLTEPEAERLGQLFRRTWSLIAAEFPDHAEAMRTALFSLMPLAPADNGRSQGATSFQAFGSLAVSTVSDPEAFALSLIHEFQHMKLSAVIDMFDLHLPDPRPRYFAPWRPDPRPISALLHGTYAHVGVCDFWRRRRTALRDSAAIRSAHFEFALWRRLSLLAVRTLLDSGQLTKLGVAFVAPLATKLDRWGAEPIPADIDRAAADSALAYAVRWRLVHGSPCPRDLARLAAAPRPAWLPEPLDLVALTSAQAGQTGDRPGQRRAQAEPALAEPAPAEPALAALIRLAITTAGPAISGIPSGPVTSATPSVPALQAGDAAYLAGRFGAAARAYVCAIEQGEPDGWIGLAVAANRTPAGSGPLLWYPELTQRLHAAAHGRAGPIEVADWLGSVLSTP